VTAAFRPVNAATVATALEFQSRLYEHETLPFRADLARRALEQLIAEPQWGGAWLIEAGGEPAGYLMLTVGYSLEFGGRYGLLDELYLEPQWQGKGLGAAAIAFAEEECRRRGLLALRLEVGYDNPRALALYKRNGFAAEERHLMTKWITHAG
jgi:GNAT superfamily N-acetyltransferase